MEERNSDAEQELRKLMPTTFGKMSRESNTVAQIEQSKRKLDRASSSSGDDEHSDDSNEDEEEEEEEDDDDDDYDDDEFPVSHELLIKTHERAVTSVTADISGSRLITGSLDCTLKLHDFSSMTPTTIRAFRSVDPTAAKGSANVETHPVHQVLFNPLSPSRALVVTAHPQAAIISRDGEVLATFVKGDMYLRDMHNTKGHVSEVTSAAWNPHDKEVCVTAGTDSTVRIWNVNNPRTQREVIVHKSKTAGSAGRTRMTAIKWSSSEQGGNDIIVSAALDGSLVMWNGKGPYNRPVAEIRDAHAVDTWTSGLDVSSDGRLVVTKGGDNTIKLWDTRSFKKPISAVDHPSISSQYPTAGICFSPSSSNVITGSGTGHLYIFNSATLKPELVTPVTPGSALISVLWHEKLNQIISGSANAETHVLYSPNISTGGAKIVMTKAPKRRHIDDDPNLTMDLAQGVSGDSIYANGQPIVSGASRHPNVGLTASGKSRDPRRPHMPASTPFAKSQPDEKHIKEHIPLSSMREEDPREALLKYADKAQNDPMFTKAWSKTQPKTIYADLSDEEADEAPDRKKLKK